MSKRKFEEELARHVEEPFLPHLVPELEMKKKKLKLSWDGSPEIVVRTMLDCGANMPVVLHALVEVYKIPRVLRSHLHVALPRLMAS